MKRGGFFYKNKKILLFLFGILIFFSFLVAEDVPTEIFVQNSPPYLLELIPNQYWPQDVNYTNAFDLDDYFVDANGDELFFSFSSVENITIVIDPITNMVSFYPEAGFLGLRNVTFYAQDQSYNASSNSVGLYVGVDNESPTWRSPAKSKGDVYQNDQINFSVIWNDNAGLSHFIFSIKQAGSWVNYSSTELSGKEDIAIYQIQISASASTVVYWRMYAWDTSENMNVTETQQFTVATPTGTPGAPPGGGEEEDYGEGTAEEGGDILDILSDLELTPQRRLKDFSFNLFDIKLSMKQGTTKTVILKVTNIGTEELLITMNQTGLWNFVIFSEDVFELLPGNSKEITIDFEIPRSAYPGQYFGFIWGRSEAVNKTVPVVLDINAIDLNYDLELTIPEEFKLVHPGDNSEANIYIRNIKDVFETNASLYYAIKDFIGIVYNFSEERINFSTSLSLNRSLQVPEGTREGRYIFYARVSDEENIAIDSDVFEVGERFTLSAFLKSKGIFFLIFLLGFFLAIFMVKYQKDRRKERIIHLYMMLNKLKNLIKQEKNQEALELFLRIKNQYREPLSKEVLQDKEKLKNEMLKLYEVINPGALKRIKEKEKETQTKQGTPAGTTKIPEKITSPESSQKQKSTEIPQTTQNKQTINEKKQPEKQQEKQTAPSTNPPANPPVQKIQKQESIQKQPSSVKKLVSVVKKPLKEQLSSTNRVNFEIKNPQLKKEDSKNEEK